jgi:hypothetical protein
MAGEKKGKTWTSLVVPIVLIAIGAWQFHARRSAGTAVGWWPWVLIVWGAVGVLINGFSLVLGSFAVDSPEEAAEGIARLEDGLWSGAHEYRKATAADMRGLDGRFYESATAALAAQGYRHLGDVVDVTSARASSWARAVIRVMLSADGRVMGGIYHVKLSGFPRLLQLVGVLSRNMRCVSLETELDDGTFVTTTNDRESNLTSEFPGIARLQLTAATPVDEMVGEHAQNLRHALSCEPTVAPRAFRTLEEVLASQNRMEELKSAHRSSPRFDATAEMERIAGRELSDSERELAQEAQRRRTHPRSDGA